MIGSRLLPLLVAAGHDVTGTTRSAERAGMIEKAGGTPVVVDVYDVDALTAAVIESQPDLVMHQLTDLPDNAADIPARAAANSRMRTEGTANLLAAALAAGGARMLAQSIAWAGRRRGLARGCRAGRGWGRGSVWAVLRSGHVLRGGSPCAPADPCERCCSADGSVGGRGTWELRAG
ncbi:NAD(P)H-binding protein [Promicromonospora sp. NPDC023805]|uniref:NAD(P)H-binding protein n=1 Tax=Promicromonospora sp. NPDC023805 TaxID=3154696 RepID=UPI0033E47608